MVGFAGESKVVSHMYGKINVIVSNTNKMLVVRTEVHTMLVRIANREDSDQTVSGWLVAFLAGNLSVQNFRAFKLRTDYLIHHKFR